MTIWRRIFKGLAALTTSTGVSFITGVVSAVLTFHYLVPEEYGRITLLLSFAATARIFFDLGAKGIFTSEIAQAHGANNFSTVKGLVQTYGRFVGITSTLASLTFVGIYLWQQNISYLIIAGYTLLFGINNGLQTVFLSYSEYHQSAGQQISRSVARLLLLFLLPLIPSSALFWYVLLTYPMVELVTLLFSIPWTRPIFHSLKTVDSAEVSFWELFKQQGIYTTLVYPLKQVISELPIWLLRVMVGETAVGIYGAAQKAYSLIFSLFANVETILTPMLPSQLTQNPDKVKVAIRQSQKYTFWIAVITIIGSYISASWMISLLTSNAYDDVIEPFRWMLFVLLTIPFIQSHRPILFALRQQKWLLLIRLIKLITFIPLLLVFIEHNGATGAVQAIVIDALFHLFTRWVILKRVAPNLWVSPLTIFKIEEFDLKLWTQITQLQFGKNRK